MSEKEKQLNALQEWRRKALGGMNRRYQIEPEATSKKQLPTMTDERFLELAAEEEAMSDNYRKQLAEAMMSEKEKELPNLWIEVDECGDTYSATKQQDLDSPNLYISAEKVEALIEQYERSIEDPHWKYHHLLSDCRKLIDGGK